MSPNTCRVETAMFGWFDEVHGGMEVDSKYFAQRSELFHILVRDDVTSFDSMLLHLIANGTMESDDAMNRTSFYAALILRYMPHENSCINDPNQKSDSQHLRCPPGVRSAQHIAGRENEYNS